MRETIKVIADDEGVGFYAFDGDRRYVDTPHGSEWCYELTWQDVERGTGGRTWDEHLSEKTWYTPDVRAEFLQVCGARLLVKNICP